jgi:hypothetical protein
MCGLHPRVLSREVFKNFKILPLQFHYIYSLVLFAVNNGDLYHNVSHIHGVNARHNFDLYLHKSNLLSCQKGTYYSGAKQF